jgi:hypothetical protein
MSDERKRWQVIVRAIAAMLLVPTALAAVTVVADRLIVRPHEIYFCGDLLRSWFGLGSITLGAVAAAVMTEGPKRAVFAPVGAAYCALAYGLHLYEAEQVVRLIDIL